VFSHQWFFPFSQVLKEVLHPDLGLDIDVDNTFEDVLTTLQNSLRQVLLLLSSPLRSFRPPSDGTDVGGGGEAEGEREREKELQRKWSQVFISNTLAKH
jgi:hypothetical protein